jgi:hypothetical protein
MGAIGYQNKDKRQIHARSLLEEETNKDFTKATYLALANVMKLLRIGIKQWLPRRSYDFYRIN